MPLSSSDIRRRSPACTSSVRRAAPLDVGVLLTAERGADVDSVAREIHGRSRRAEAPYVVVECDSADASRLGQLLFGTVSTTSPVSVVSPSALLASTPADLEPIARDSRLAAARGGTLFLQDVTELPAATLARLVASVRDETAQRLWRALESLLTAGQRHALDQLVEVPSGAHVSDLERWRKGPPRRASGPQPAGPSAGRGGVGAGQGRRIEHPRTAGPPDELLAGHAATLEAGYRQAYALLTANDAVRIDEEGRIHLTGVKAIEEPPSLVDLRKRTTAMLPRVDLPEVILEVMSWEPGIAAAFTAASGARSRLEDLDTSITACLAAHSMNVGYRPIARKGVPALEWSRLSHVFQNYFRPETIGPANAPMVARQAVIPLARAWRAADGRRCRRDAVRGAGPGPVRADRFWCSARPTTSAAYCA